MSIRTKRNSRRFIAAAAAVAVAASSFIATSAGPAGALTSAAPSAERYSGDNRFASAAAVATSTRAAADCATAAAKATLGCKTFATASAVIIVNGRSSANGADGLAAAALAGRFNAPILLVEQNSIPADTLAALTALTTAPWGTAADPQLERLIVVGGTAAVSAAVLGELAALSGEITASRVNGADRYSTAINVALAVSAAATPTTGPDKVILAVGDNWPDALAASALAYRGIGTADRQSPILLNNGATLRSDVAAALQAMNTVNEVLVVGGTTAIPDAVLTAIRALKNANGGAIGAVRAGGADRYATAVAASASSSAFATSALGVAAATAVVLANGSNAVGPWDALSAGPLAGRLGAALLLTEAAAPPAATAAWHTKAANTLSKVYAVGGTSVISDAAATAAVGAATPTSPILSAAALAVSASATPATLSMADNGLGANVVTLSALATGPYKGVIGNGFFVTTSVVPTATAVAVSASVSATATNLATWNGGKTILITGPSQAVIDATLLTALQAGFTAAGFTLAVDATSVSAAATVGNLRTEETVGARDAAGGAVGASNASASTSGGKTGGTLTLTFNTGVATTSAILDAGIAASAGGAVLGSMTAVNPQSGACTAAGVCTFALVDTITEADLVSLTAATARPEYRLPAGAASTLAQTVVPVTVVPLTVS